MGRGHRTCEACGVKERHLSENNTLAFFNFPLNPNRCREWLRAVGNEELVHLPIEKLHVQRNICGNHFRRQDYNKRGNRLKRHVIPTLNFTAVPLTDTQLAEFPQYVWKDKKVTMPEEITSTSQDVAMPEETSSTSQLKKKVIVNLSQNDDLPEATTSPSQQEPSVMEETSQNDEQECTFSWQQNSDVVSCEELEFFPPEEETPQPLQKTHTKATLEYRHENLVCNICAKDIIGFRYVCVQCADVDLCATCEARRAHHYHYVLRVPPNSPQSEVFEKLRTIRRALLSDAIVDLQPSTLQDSLLIKEEEPDPMDVEHELETRAVPTQCKATPEDNIETLEDDITTPKDNIATPEESDATYNIDSEDEYDSDSDSTVPAPRIPTSPLLQSQTSTQPKVIQPMLVQPRKRSVQRKVVVYPSGPPTAAVPKQTIVSSVQPLLHMELQKAKDKELSKPGVRIIDLRALPEHVRKKFKIQQTVKPQENQPKLRLKEACIKLQRLKSSEINTALHKS